jgi:hypothetical protein
VPFPPLLTLTNLSISDRPRFHRNTHSVRNTYLTLHEVRLANPFFPVFSLLLLSFHSLLFYINGLRVILGMFLLLPVPLLTPFYR